MFNSLNLGKNYKVAQVLLTKKARVDVADNTGSTALHYAVFNGKIANTLRFNVSIYTTLTLYSTYRI